MVWFCDFWNRELLIILGTITKDCPIWLSCNIIFYSWSFDKNEPNFYPKTLPISPLHESFGWSYHSLEIDNQ